MMFVGSGGTTLQMGVSAWQTDWLSSGKVGRLRECSIRMAKAHLVLRWPKLMWSHLYTCISLPASGESSPKFHALPWKAATVGQSACYA